MHIYPQPRFLKPVPRTWLRRATTPTRINIRSTFASDPRNRSELIAFSEDQKLALTYDSSGSEALLCIDEDRSLGDDAYNLTIKPSGVRLTSNSSSGLYYGLATLSQIMKQSSRQIPCLSIRDSPLFPERGVMLDISRCKVPTLETIFTLIDQLALLKFNQLQLYIEHTYAFHGHEAVWKDSSPLTTSELLRIQDYCQKHFINLVPNLNSFGHFERWLRHPEYQEFAESPHGFVHPLTGQRVPYGSTLTPNRRSLDLLKDLYDQFLPLHDSDRFNIGGDEPWELGTGRSQARCRKQGIQRVYTQFLQQINNLVKQHNKHTMIWADVVIEHPEVLPDLPEGATAMLWGYEAKHPFPAECRALDKSGMPFYVCPGTSSWNTILGRTDNMRRNIRRAAEYGRQHGARGLLVTDWGDRGHHQYLPFSYPGFVVAAGHAWTGRPPTEKDINSGLQLVFDLRRASADVILSLGHLDEASEVYCRNSTVFNHGLFPGLLGEDAALAIKPARARELLKRLTTLSERASKLTDSLIADELMTAAQLAAHGIRRIQRIQIGHGRPTELRKELRELIDQHRTCWLRRNRSGGLEESVDHLTASLQKIN